MEGEISEWTIKDWIAFVKGAIVGVGICLMYSLSSLLDKFK